MVNDAPVAMAERIAEQLFGHRYARFRSRVKVACQCLIAAAAQNMKKIAISLWPKPKTALA